MLCIRLEDVTMHFEQMIDVEGATLGAACKSINLPDHWRCWLKRDEMKQLKKQTQ